MDLAITLGTSNTVIMRRGHGIVLNQATTIAYTRDRKGKTRIVAVGDDAKRMIGKAAPEVILCNPVSNGRIVDLDAARLLMREFSKTIGTRRSALFTRISSLTQSELDMFKATAYGAYYHVEFVPATVAAAINAGYSPVDATSCLTVLITDDAVDINVLSFGAIVHGGTINQGVAMMTDTLSASIKKKHNIIISRKNAEDAMTECATLLLNDKTEFIIEGIEPETNIAREIILTGDDCREVLTPIYEKIVKGIKSVLAECSPDILSDIRHGNFLIGGSGAQLRGLPEFIIRELDINPEIIPVNAATLGAGKLLHNPALLKKIITAN